MKRIQTIIYIIILSAVGFWCSDIIVKQERCVVKYWNPKYVCNMSVLTGRASRKDPYLTNITGTTLVPYGNNVSFGLILRMKTGGDFRVTARACDTIKSRWMQDFMMQYTDINLKVCPFPPAQYHYWNMELPPKNTPLPIVNGDYYIIYELFVTDTKEKIVDISTLLHVQKKKAG